VETDDRKVAVESVGENGAVLTAKAFETAWTGLNDEEKNKHFESAVAATKSTLTNPEHAEAKIDGGAFVEKTEEDGAMVDVQFEEDPDVEEEAAANTEAVSMSAVSCAGLLVNDNFSHNNDATSEENCLASSAFCNSDDLQIYGSTVTRGDAPKAKGDRGCFSSSSDVGCFSGGSASSQCTIC
jgi:hypothetical protein